MIYIGTAGYSYQDWVGTVYPQRMRKGDMLSYYAREFSFSEINSTYYRMPTRKMIEGVIKKTPPSFRFAVKAYQQMTHSRDAGADLFREFGLAVAPLADAGKLACILLQFPYSFHNTPENRDYLKKVRELMPDYPLAVEFRNARWIRRETFELLAGEGISFVSVDEPVIRGLVRPVAVVTAPPAYVRFHGRNAAAWYDHKEAYERYNYLYSEDELKEWLPRLSYLHERAGEVYVSFNNHYRGQAVVNARMMRALLK